MHFFAPDKNFWGGHGIVGGQTPLGLGMAFALKHKGLKGLVYVMVMVPPTKAPSMSHLILLLFGLAGCLHY